MENHCTRVRFRSAGFTLIHLLIVLAVIAILSAMALPLFATNVARQQIVNSKSLIDVVKNGVVKYYGQFKALPSSNEVANLPAANKLIGNYVTSVEVNGGVVTVTFGNNSHASIKEKHLTIRPAIDAAKPGPIFWICAGKPVPAGLTVAGSNATDVPLIVLPVSKDPEWDCR